KKETGIGTRGNRCNKIYWRNAEMKPIQSIKTYKEVSTPLDLTISAAYDQFLWENPEAARDDKRPLNYLRYAIEAKTVLVSMAMAWLNWHRYK
ncbi:MAG: hypothetical protein WBN39_10775, partial [Flavobacteriaceae bacterium]